MSEFDEAVGKLFGSMSPHMRELGFEIISLESGVCVAKVPYREEFVGDPLTRVLHGGVVTSLLDSTGGAAALSKIQTPIALATLDLRIDYLRPAALGHAVFARVECYKATKHVVFTRGIAYDAAESDPVASMSATYMLNTLAARADGEAKAP